MRKKYQESIRKKKEDEERLKLIKIEQEKQLKEINQLIYKRQLDEKKLLLLTEGKLNKYQRKIYRNSLKNENYKYNINYHEFLSEGGSKNKNKYDKKENEEILKKMKINYALKDSKHWNKNENKNKKSNNNNSSSSHKYEVRKNNFKGKKNSCLNNALYSFQNSNDYKSNDNLSKEKHKSTKNKNSKKDLGTMTRINEYISISPTNNDNKHFFNLSPSNDEDSQNKLHTELHQIPPFSPLHFNEKSKNRIIFGKNNIEVKNKNLIGLTLDDMSKNPYQKKLKKTYKNKNINTHTPNSISSNKSSDKNYNFNDNKKSNKNTLEEFYNYRNTKNSSKSKNSFTEIREIKEITSKIADQIEKKIEIINKNSFNNPQIYKTRSTPRINPFLKYSSNNLNQSNNTNKKESQKFKKRAFKQSYDNIIINNEGKKFIKDNSFSEDIDFGLPTNSKKDCLIELSKLEKHKSAKFGNLNNRNNNDLNHNIMENINKKNKKGKIINVLKKENTMYENKENKNFNFEKQKNHNNKFMFGLERNNYSEVNENFFNENNSWFFPYYKEIYG